MEHAMPRTATIAANRAVFMLARAGPPRGDSASVGAGCPEGCRGSNTPPSAKAADINREPGHNRDRHREEGEKMKELMYAGRRFQGRDIPDGIVRMDRAALYVRSKLT